MRRLLLMTTGIDRESVVKSLDIMWKGLLAILVVIVAVMVVTWLMQTVSEKIAKNKENRASDKENGVKNSPDEEREL